MTERFRPSFSLARPYGAMLGAYSSSGGSAETLLIGVGAFGVSTYFGSWAPAALGISKPLAIVLPVVATAVLAVTIGAKAEVAAAAVVASLAGSIIGAVL